MHKILSSLQRTCFLLWHKEEFYDIRAKEWNTRHSDLYMEEMDAVDDENICNALASHKGSVL